MLLTLRHLLGVRFCPRCPNCAASERPCSDAFGSNALATGGVLGRVDAVFGSIECQKSGTLHAHLQVFVQCRHQRGSLAGLLDLGKPELQTLLQRYASYTAHVRRSVYCDPDGWERDRAAVEEEWPEYKDFSFEPKNRPKISKHHLEKGSGTPRTGPKESKAKQKASANTQVPEKTECLAHSFSHRWHGGSDASRKHAAAQVHTRVKIPKLHTVLLMQTLAIYSRPSPRTRHG